MSRIKAVIFDMDGTLLNSIDDITDSVNYIMDQYGLKKWTVDEIKYKVGSGAAKLIERSVPEGRDNPKFQDILKDYEAYYFEHCNIKTGPYNNILPMLKALSEKGYKLAIVSNKSMDAVVELKDKYFGEYVSVAVGVTDRLKRKPAPDECFEAMKLLGVEKEDCIYVGDSEVDYQTAVNTGIPCISCMWGFRTREDLIEAGAKDNIYVDDPLEIPEILK